MRASILTALVLCLVSVAYAEGTAKTKGANDRASKSAQDAKGPDPKSAKPLSDAEAQVINALHAADQTEVAAGKLAEKNAQSPAVKRYGRMLVKDHSAHDRKLATLASRRSFTLTGMAHDTSDLADKKGAEFDTAFINMMVKDHADAVAMVKRAMDTCDDPEVKALLDQTLPTLQRHQTEAIKLQQQTRDEHARAQ